MTENAAVVTLKIFVYVYPPTSPQNFLAREQNSSQRILAKMEKMCMCRNIIHIL